MTTRVIRVLGSLGIEIDGRTVELASANQRKLLAALTAARGEVVSVDRLIEAIWSDAPPASAKASLQTYLHRLRSAIGEEVIVTRPPGYVLDPSTFECDATEFERLVTQERTAESAEAVELASRALALWSGPAFAEFAHHEHCRPAAVHLEELRRSLTERRIDALIDIGATDRAIAEAERLCVSEPLREQAHAVFMRALAAEGRIAEALRVYESYRRHLGEETGLVPSSSLRQIERQLLEELEAPEPPPATPPIAVVAKPGAPTAIPPTRPPTIRPVMAGVVAAVWLPPRDAPGGPGASVRSLVNRRADTLFGDVAAYRGGTVARRGERLTVGVFRGAGEALLAAIELQQVLAKDRRRHGDASIGAARIGVSVGEVVQLDEGIDGPAVEEAIRYAGDAGAGAILASPIVEHAMYPAEGITFEPAGHAASGATAAGSHDELEPFDRGPGAEPAPLRVSWDLFPDLAARLGMPARLAGSLAHVGDVVGRSDTLDRMTESLDAIERGTAVLVPVFGVAGIGKTTVLAAFAQRAVARGCAVLFGSCPRDGRVPYAAPAMAVADLIDRHPGGPRLLGPYRNDLATLIEPFSDERSTPPRGTDAEARRAELADAVVQLLRALSMQLPAVVILDDLHWADPATVELLELVLAGVRDARVLLVVALREFEGGANPPLGELFTTAATTVPVRRVNIAGITADAISAMAQSVGVSLDPDAVTTLTRRTGGNPFLVRELLADIAAGGAGDALAERLHDVVAGRLGMVGDACRQMLAVAAVAGTEFDPMIVAAASALSADEVFDLLDEAVRSGNVRETTTDELRLTFDHELLRDSLLSTMTQLRRARHHRELGLAIERRFAHPRPSDVPDLARHFAAAAALGERPRACRYNREAAERALLANADAAAADYYRTALDFSDEEVVRAEVMVGLGEALRRHGDRSYRGVLGDAASIADANGAFDVMARAVLTDDRGTFGLAFDVDEPRVRRLRRALERVGTDSPATYARLLAALAVELVWSSAPQESIDLAERALAMARSSGEDGVLADVLQLRQWVVYHPTAARLAEARELTDLADRVGDLALQFAVAGHATFTYLRAGDPVRLDESIELARWLARRLDRPAIDWMLALRESPIAMLRGRFDDARTLIERSAELGARTEQPDAVLQRSVQTFWLHYEVLGAEAQRAELRNLAKYRSRMPVLTLPSLAFRFQEVGLDAEAVEVIPDPSATAANLPRDQVWLWNTCMLAAMAARRSTVEGIDRQALGAFVERLAPHGDEIANTVFASVGPVARYLGLLASVEGDLTGAITRFQQALDVAERVGAPSWAARCKLDLAEALAASAARSAPGAEEAAAGARAAALRAEAMVTASALGLPLVLDRAAAPAGATS